MVDFHVKNGWCSRSLWLLRRHKGFQQDNFAGESRKLSGFWTICFLFQVRLSTADQKSAWFRKQNRLAEPTIRNWASILPWGRIERIGHHRTRNIEPEEGGVGGDDFPALVQPLITQYHVRYPQPQVLLLHDGRQGVVSVLHTVGVSYGGRHIVSVLQNTQGDNVIQYFPLNSDALLSGIATGPFYMYFVVPLRKFGSVFTQKVRVIDLASSIDLASWADLRWSGLTICSSETCSFSNNWLHGVLFKFSVPTFRSEPPWICPLHQRIYCCFNTFLFPRYLDEKEVPCGRNSLVQNAVEVDTGVKQSRLTFWLSDDLSCPTKFF